MSGKEVVMVTKEKQTKIKAEVRDTVARAVKEFLEKDRLDLDDLELTMLAFA